MQGIITCGCDVLSGAKIDAALSPVAIVAVLM